jgi:uncharacterized membrane protein
MMLSPLLIALAAQAPVASPPPPEPYRAHGTEPFWSIEIANGQASFAGPDNPRFSEPIGPRQLRNGQTSTYTGQRIILVVVAGAECNNGMSEETWPDTTIAIVDGQIYANGCGGEPLPGTGSR